VAGRRIYEGGTRVLSWVLIALGVGQIALGVVRGVSPLVYVVGVVFIALGAARLWLARARG
jgi:vacuolar-type H+-ATPase subunit I/STV1